MTSDRAVELLTGLMWTSLLLAGPVLATALLLGLLISIVQVATQLQESTLSYVPKLLGCAFVLVLLAPWMLDRLTGYASGLMRLIPQLG